MSCHLLPHRLDQKYRVAGIQTKYPIIFRKNKCWLFKEQWFLFYNFKSFCLFENSENDVYTCIYIQREIERERDLASDGSSPIWLQKAGLGQLGARN